MKNFVQFAVLAVIVFGSLFLCCLLAYHLHMVTGSNLTDTNPFADDVVILTGFFIWFGLVFVIGFGSLIISDIIEDRQDRARRA